MRKTKFGSVIETREDLFIEQTNVLAKYLMCAWADEMEESIYNPPSFINAGEIMDYNFIKETIQNSVGILRTCEIHRIPNAREELIPLFHTTELEIGTGAFGKALGKSVMVAHGVFKQMERLLDELFPEIPAITDEEIDHELKIWPNHFKNVISGAKKSEVRVFDREFKVGDLIKLVEYDPEIREKTGKYVYVVITHILDGRLVDGLGDRYCVLSFDILIEPY